MRIHNSITTLMIAGTMRSVLSSPLQAVPAALDSLEISDAAKQKIDQLQQGYMALEQAVTRSRQSVRNAAMERVKYIKDYLDIVARLSPAGDRGAASEAARMAKEIKNAAADFKGNIASGEVSGIRKEIAGFAGMAGDALNIAKGLMERYLQKRSVRQNGDNELEKEVRSAFYSLGDLV